MVAALHNLAVIHDNDKVGIPDGRQTVGNHNAGAPLHDSLHGILYGLLGAGIHIGCGFIQNQDFGIGNKRTGNGKELPLSLADRDAPEPELSKNFVAILYRLRWMKQYNALL